MTTLLSLTAADIKRTIDMYVLNDKPPASAAKSEIEKWLRHEQTITGAVHSYSVRTTGGLSAPTIINVDVVMIANGPIHSFQFDEARWMGSSYVGPSRSPFYPPAQDETEHKTTDTPEEAYDRAMRGV